MTQHDTTGTVCNLLILTSFYTSVFVLIMCQQSRYCASQACHLPKLQVYRAWLEVHSQTIHYHSSSIFTRTNILTHLTSSNIKTHQNNKKKLKTSTSPTFSISYQRSALAGGPRSLKPTGGSSVMGVPFGAGGGGCRGAGAGRCGGIRAHGSGASQGSPQG